jgi:hypothetical protein
VQVDNVKMDLVDKEWSPVDWTGVAQDRERWKDLVNEVMSLRVPQNAGKLSCGYTTGGLWSSAQRHIVTWSVRQYVKVLNDAFANTQIM